MYAIAYDPDAWVRISSGAPEWRQVVTVKLDGGMHLVVIVARGVGGPPRVVEARIEQVYVTRHEGWKRRIVQRLNQNDVTIERCVAS
jgi:hypothetical protein